MDDTDIAKVYRELDRLQGSAIKSFVVLRPAPIGLGGQITGRIETLLIALGTSRQAVFQSLIDFPYGQSFDLMCPQVHANESLCDIPLINLFIQQDNQAVAYDPMTRSVHDHYDYLFAAIREKLDINITSVRSLIGIIFSWMRPTEVMARLSQAAAERLGIGPNTLGVHFRRGDKKVETAPVPAHDFNLKIAEMFKIWRFDTLFIASDSPEAPRFITAPQGVKVIFDETERRYNNANHKMLFKSEHLRTQETEAAFINISLLSRCGGIVGQDNAHFATIAAACIELRLGHERTIKLIDGLVRENRSVFWRSVFFVYRRLRRLAASIFPAFSGARRAESASVSMTNE